MSGFPPIPVLDVQATSIALTGLSVLFLLRVAGQVLVVLRQPRWLPPMDQWYSGLLPYPRLLASQVLILIAMAVVILGLRVDAEWAVGPHPTLGSVLVTAAYLYGASMVPRYVVRMARRPDQRWLGGCIPIVFHVVLASWLLILASLWRQG